MTHVTIVASPTTGHPLTRDFIWNDEAGCAVLAGELADVLMPVLAQGATFYIALHGTLGAGKTTFTRHLLRRLGVSGRIKSPSYAVVEPHELPSLNIHHFDFYRFDDPQEWEDAGFRDLFASPGLKLAEWPDKAGGLLPVADLQIHIAPPDGADEQLNQTRRHVHIDAETTAGRQALSALAAAGTAGVVPHG